MMREVCGSVLSHIPGVRTDSDREEKILCVGLACIDIVQVVKEFPVEDTDSR